MSVTIYHNPRCSKSRATLALLQEQGVELEIIKYLEAAPSLKTLKTILSSLGFGPRDLMRKGEPVYKDLKLDDKTLGQEALVKAMVDHPILIERPIVLNGDKAAIGRPPEAVLEIL